MNASQSMRTVVLLTRGAYAIRSNPDRLIEAVENKRVSIELELFELDGDSKPIKMTVFLSHVVGFYQEVLVEEEQQADQLPENVLELRSAFFRDRSSLSALNNKG